MKTVHELVALYKQTATEMTQSHLAAMMRHNRRTAYLQSLDPNTPLDHRGNIWAGFEEWCKARRKAASEAST